MKLNIVKLLEKVTLVFSDYLFGGRLSTLDKRTRRIQRSTENTNFLICREHDLRQQEILNAFLREHDK